ncbi:Transcriptional regulatory protein LiaR [bacterium HR37]|nr:Transcriptional regulatory protein LiaR [bacterium HR37]
MESSDKKKILLIEDEVLTARNVKNTLEKVGYSVSVISGSKVKDILGRVSKICPHLVVMDVVIGKKHDGIEIAKKIRSELGVPIVYLTSYTDRAMLERVKVTEPYGYIIKPFEMVELLSTIEIALYKCEMERRLKETKKRLIKTLESIGDGVIIVDNKGTVTFLNNVAEVLTGWKRESALGRNVKHIIDADSKNKPFSFMVSQIRDNSNDVIGFAFILQNTGGLRESSFSNTIGFSAGEKQETIKVLLITPSTFVREGVCKLLEYEEGIELVAYALETKFMVPLIEEKRPDVVIVDTALGNPEITGILELVMERYGDTKVVVLLHSPDDRFIVDAISLGVKGFILDTSNREQFIGALRAAYKGEIWLEFGLMTRIINRFIPFSRIRHGELVNRLTRREKEIVKLVVDGYTNKQISRELYISQNTVKTHLVNIFKKLGVTSRLQLARLPYIKYL